MSLLTSRRSLILGLTSLVVAPSLVKATSLMQIKGELLDPWVIGYQYNNNFNINESVYNYISPTIKSLIAKDSVWSKLSIKEKYRIITNNGNYTDSWVLVRKSKINGYFQ